MVYCKSDTASLCLSCDRNIHAANALSRRHSRTLLCDKCNSQPAFVRCIEKRVSLCQNCDLIEHSGFVTASANRRQVINSYSDCPSSTELCSIWPFVQDLPYGNNSTCEKELSSMSLTENGLTASQLNASGPVDVKDGDHSNKLNSWIGSSSLPLQSNNLQDDAQHLISNPISSKIYSGTKAPALCGDDKFYDFNIDEIDLSIEDYHELFATPYDNPGMSSYFNMDMSAADLNSQGPYIAEGSYAASADSVMSSKTEPVNCFGKQAHSNISFSGLTGESTAGDYQDCGASSILPMGGPPWFPPCPESSVPSSDRTNAVIRYKEKKKMRKFDKRVRYASRKARADVRKRVKGRFVKSGDDYDYDPLIHTRSF